MSDRELLEAAARAAGYKVEPHPNEKLYPDLVHTLRGKNWNPLTDDGDALRLAVAVGPLELSISEYGTAARKPAGQWYGCEAHLYGGKQAATRRAIVRAAAALARAEGGKDE